MLQRSGSITATIFSLCLPLGCLVACSSDVEAPVASAGSQAAAGSTSSAGASSPGGTGLGGAVGTAGGEEAAGTSRAGTMASATAGAPAQADAGFKLLYRDDFDSFDAARWQVMTHSWDTNLALFSQESVSVKDGHLELALRPAPAGTVDAGGAAKSFLGAEVRSTDTLTYGRVRARIKLARGSAVVSSLVTIYTPWPADNWNELDIEHLGAKPTATQFNTMVYTGAPVTAPATSSVTPTQDPYSQTLAFAASADFHVYAVEWTPASAKFYIDDLLAYTWTKRIDLMTLPQNVLMTIWASSSAAWAGPVTDETGKAVASYDWIELYEYNAP